MKTSAISYASSNEKQSSGLGQSKAIHEAQTQLTALTANQSSLQARLADERALVAAIVDCRARTRQHVEHSSDPAADSAELIRLEAAL